MIRLRVPQLPERLWWDHNAHYHRWLLRQLPHGTLLVLDVGCGAGRLARRLAERAAAVDAVDAAPTMIERAKALATADARIRWIVGDVLDPELQLRPEGYDAVTAVSSLHHLPLRPGLERLAGLVRPGGVLAVVGLYRPATPSDYALSALALPANALVGLVLAARGRAGKPDDVDMPVRPPEATLGDIRGAAREALPGARVRRRLFFRYVLVWRRPAATGS